MNVKIHSIHFDADQKLIEFIQLKADKLNTFIDNIIGAEVFLRLDKSKSTENKLVEIKIDIPGADIFAKKQAKTFEEATDEALNAIRKQIVKHKEKIRGI